MDWNEMTCKVTYVIPRLLPRVFSDPFSLMFKSLKKNNCFQKSGEVSAYRKLKLTVRGC